MINEYILSYIWQISYGQKKTLYNYNYTPEGVRSSAYVIIYKM